MGNDWGFCEDMGQSARTSTNDWIDCPALMNSGAEYVIPSVGPASAVGPDVRVAGPGPAARRAAGFHGEYGLGRDRAGGVVACRSRSGSRYARSRSSTKGCGWETGTGSPRPV
jgi:hypothetical protein